MKQSGFDGSQMSIGKVLVLLSTAALILVLFMTRTECGTHQDELPVASESVGEEQFIYISAYDSLFRQYADTLFDWKLLAAIAYVESKFDTTALSSMGASGIMQIMPPTYKQTLTMMGLSDTLTRSVALDIAVAVRHLNELNKRFHFINERERINYILGSYNGGSNHIFDAMRVARKNGVNRYNWSSLTPVLASLSEPEVYNDSVCRFGKFNATETLNYVRNVTRKYSEYRERELLFKAFEKLASNDGGIN